MSLNYVQIPPKQPLPNSAANPDIIGNHSGSKYIRQIRSCVPNNSGQFSMLDIDVYNVITAFDVTCPATAHAIKKLLCAGICGKGSVKQDLTEAIDAIKRAIDGT